MPRTLGVEEEFNLVDLKTRRLTARAPELLAELSDTYVAELQRCVVEMNSGVVDTLEGLRDRSAGPSPGARRCRGQARHGRGRRRCGAVVGARRDAGHPDRPVSPDARRLPAAGPRAVDLRHAGARRSGRPRRGGDRREPGRAVSADAAGAFAPVRRSGPTVPTPAIQACAPWCGSAGRRPGWPRRWRRRPNTTSWSPTWSPAG